MFELFDPVHYEANQPPYYEPDKNVLLSISDQEILKKLRPEFNKQKGKIQKDFEKSLKTSLSGPQNASALAKLADGIVTEIANYLDKGANAKKKDDKLGLGLSRLTICATNHYGLGFRLPYAPLNLICLCEENPEKVEEPIRHLLRLLWELGFKVRARTAKISDFLQEALTNGNATAQLFSLRPIVGNLKLAERLIADFHKQLSPEKKHHFALEFHDARKRRYQQHQARLLNADILNHSGGLRDICSLNMLAKFTFPETMDCIVPKDDNPLCSYLPQLLLQERKKLRYIWKFYWTVLSLLQYRIAAYATKLPPELLPILAHDLGYRGKENSNLNAVQRFLRHCYSAFRVTQRILWVINPSFLEETEVWKEDESSYEILPTSDGRYWLYASPLGRLHVSHDAIVAKPSRILEALEVSRKRGLKIGWSLQRSVVRLACRKLKINPEDIDWPRLLDTLTTKPPYVEPKLETVLSLTRILLVWLPHWRELIGYFENDEIEKCGYSLDERIIKMFQLYQKMDTLAQEGTDEAELGLAAAIFRNLSEKHALFVAILAYRTPQVFGLKKALEITEYLSKLFKLSQTEASKAYRLVLCQNLLVDVILSKEKITDTELTKLAALIQTPNFLKLLFVFTVLILKPNDDWDHWLQPLALSLFQKLNERLTPYRMMTHSPELISGALTLEHIHSTAIYYAENISRTLLKKIKEDGHLAYQLERFKELKAVQINIVAKLKQHPISNVLQRITNTGYLIFKTRFSDLEDGYYALTIYVHYPDDLPSTDNDDIHPFFRDQIEYHLENKTSLRSLSEVTASVPLHPMTARILWVSCLQEGYVQLELTLFYVLNRSPNILKILEKENVELLAGRIERAGTKEIYVIQIALKNNTFTPEVAEDLTTKLSAALSHVCAKGVLEETTTLFTT